MRLSCARGDDGGRAYVGARQPPKLLPTNRLCSPVSFWVLFSGTVAKWIVHVRDVHTISVYFRYRLAVMEKILR